MDHVILPVPSAVPMEASQFGGDVVPHPDTLDQFKSVTSAFDPNRTSAGRLTACA
jgi:hypothetical protein